MRVVRRQLVAVLTPQFVPVPLHYRVVVRRGIRSRLPPEAPRSVDRSELRPSIRPISTVVPPYWFSPPGEGRTDPPPCASADRANDRSRRSGVSSRLRSIFVHPGGSVFTHRGSTADSNRSKRIIYRYMMSIRSIGSAPRFVGSATEVRSGGCPSRSGGADERR